MKAFKMLGRFLRMMAGQPFPTEYHRTGIFVDVPYSIIKWRMRGE